MDILILDSGIYTGHPFLKKSSVSGYSLWYDEEQNCLVRGDDFEDESGHGTAVYSIIKKGASDANIRVIKIFREDLAITEMALIRVLEYILQNENPDIINMSMGITFCREIDKLYGLCKQIADKGTIIVSAFDNNGAVSFPAAFDCVIGVSGTSEISSGKIYDYVEGSYVNIVGKGTMHRIAWRNPDYIVSTGNSFTCANITDIIAHLMKENRLTYQEIQYKLRENSRHIYQTITSDKYTPDVPFEIGKTAAIFPFNKEMHSLIRFSDILDFKIVDIYDVKYSARVGAETSKLLNHESTKSYFIKDINLIDWDAFDTLILGHMDELLLHTNQQELRNTLIDKAVEKNKKIYSFDPVGEDVMSRSAGQLFYPFVDKFDVPQNRLGKLHRLSTPVVGVFGTSSRQGKFTLQLRLRKGLQEIGYKVGQLGSEPSSFLYGFDDIFPFGYNSTVSLDSYNIIATLNEKIYSISRKDYEIIICGSQSGTIPFDIGNLEQFPIQQIAFLYGTCPDAVVLNINPYDTLDYIKRTITFIESAVNCKVVCLCLFPMDFKDGYAMLSGAKTKLSLQQCHEHKTRISEALDIPVYILGIKEEENLIVQTIVDFF